MISTKRTPRSTRSAGHDALRGVAFLVAAARSRKVSRCAAGSLLRSRASGAASCSPCASSKVRARPAKSDFIRMALEIAGVEFSGGNRVPAIAAEPWTCRLQIGQRDPRQARCECPECAAGRKLLPHGCAPPYGIFSAITTWAGSLRIERAQAVAQPRAEAGHRNGKRTRVELQDRLAMLHVVAVHGADQGRRIHDAANVRKKVADFCAAARIRLETPREGLSENVRNRISPGPLPMETS